MEDRAFARVVGVDNVAWHGNSDSLVPRVDAVRGSGCVSVEEPEIRHDTILPKKRMVELFLIVRSARRTNRRDVRLSRDVAGVSQPLRRGINSSQGAKIRDNAFVP